jgi:hypothetical protein
VIGGAATSTEVEVILQGKPQAKSWKGLKETWAGYEPDKVRGQAKVLWLDSGKKRRWRRQDKRKTVRKVEGLMAEPLEVEGGKSGENRKRKCGNGGERVREEEVNKGRREERTWRRIHPHGGASG